MTGMNMDRFAERHSSISANSGGDFGDIERVVVQNGLLVRLVGDFASVWEHFCQIDGGYRPFYCDGPDSDCPLCTAANKLSFSDNSDDQKLGRDIRAKERFYFNAIDRTPTGKAWHEQNRKTRLLTQSEKSSSIGSMLFKAIGDVVRMRTQQGQNPDPNSFDILLQKTGSGVKTKYGAQFTGDVTALTDDELAYENYKLDALAKITPRAERDAAASKMMGEDVQETAEVSTGIPDFDPLPPQLLDPPRPSTSTGATHSNAPGPAVAPSGGAQKLDLKPKSEHQDTTPTPDADPSTTMTVPCSNCNADMQFSMEDGRDIKCHECGTVYSHPAKA
jgi:ribosomal protein S27E